jgi:hypothetical protein
MAARDGERPEPAAALIEDAAAGILAWLGTRRAAIT